MRLLDSLRERGRRGDDYARLGELRQASRTTRSRPLSSMDRDPELLVGTALYPLVIDPVQWVHRRIETVEFLNARTYQRTVRVEFTMPPGPRAGEDTSGLRLIPLALISKRRRIIELFDETGRAVPFLTKAENRRAALAVLRVAAKSAASACETLPDDVLNDLRIVCEEDPALAKETLDRLLRGTDHIRAALNASEAFRITARSLAEGFLFIAVVPHEPNRRRVLDLRYREPLCWPHLTLARRWGWAPMPFALDTPGITQTEAYHFIAIAPPGLEILEGAIWNRATSDGRPHALDFNLDGGSRVHLYLRGVREQLSARAWVWISPPQAGLIRSATVSSAVSTLLLVAALIRIHVDDAAPATATSVLLAIPSGVSLFIVRPGGNSFTSQVLINFRSVVALSGFFPFAAAVSTGLAIAGEALWWTWVALTLGAACCFAILGIAYIRTATPLVREGDEETL